MTPVPELLRRGADASYGRNKNLRTVDDVADTLTALGEGVAAELGSRAFTTMIETLYEAGWQPFDLLHVVRRQQTVAVSELAAAAILHQSDLARAESRAPDQWIGQLSEICAAYPKAAVRVEATPDFLTARLRAAGKTDYIAVNDQWIGVLALLGQWQTLPRWPRIGPLPSQWPNTRPPERAPASADAGDTAAPNSKVMGRIRGLLAKADATDFEEEAETLTAKAQELMTRYSIDSLLLTDGNVGVVTRRLHIDNPHAPAKAQLLHGVGSANRVKSIWDQEYAVATLVGSEIDVEQTEMLFTSLLIQATRALSRS
ncbi:MAG: DUF2786 domain-containing protein, partial [Rhodococcus sp. (in: high G+C Gram-positive bacteria)]